MTPLWAYACLYELSIILRFVCTDCQLVFKVICMLAILSAAGYAGRPRLEPQKHCRVYIVRTPHVAHHCSCSLQSRKVDKQPTLFDGFAPDWLHLQERTPLMLAKFVGAVKLLLSYGADIAAQDDVVKFTILSPCLRWCKFFSSSHCLCMAWHYLAHSLTISVKSCIPNVCCHGDKSAGHMVSSHWPF